MGNNSMLPTFLLKLYKALKNPTLALYHIKCKLIPNKKNVHLKAIFGCDFYQNNKDIIDFTKYNGLKIDEIKSKDLEFNVMATYAKLGSTVIDIGSNIGFYTLGLSKLVGKSGSVYAFEPGPISFSILSRNVYANSHIIGDNVILNKMAVSDRDGKSNLFINTSGESDNQVHHETDCYEFKSEPFRPKIITDVISLDSYFQHCDKNKISFIKTDTQGHEYYVLKGAKNLLTSSKDIVLLIEYAPYLKSWEKFTQDEFYSLIKMMGFKIFDMIEKDCEVDNSYLKKNYGAHSFGKNTSLILRK